jgi:hypothetical protein
MHARAHNIRKHARKERVHAWTLHARTHTLTPGRTHTYPCSHAQGTGARAHAHGRGASQVFFGDARDAALAFRLYGFECPAG